MTPSPNDTQSALELLAEIRKNQRDTAEIMSEHRYWSLHFNVEVDKLLDRISELRSALPSDPSSTQINGLRRDITEFKADVAGLRSRLDDLVAVATNVKTDITDVKATLDILQSRFEESDV